jgi:hypothetical protein
VRRVVSNLYAQVKVWVTIDFWWARELHGILLRHCRHCEEEDHDNRAPPISLYRARNTGASRAVVVRPKGQWQ